MVVNHSQVSVALSELLEQAAREDDGNFFAGAKIDWFVSVVRVTLPNGQVIKFSTDVEGR